MKTFPRWKQQLLVFIGLALAVFTAYIQWFAPVDTLRTLGATQIDKLAHIAGGLFIALLVEWRYPNLLRDLPRFLAFLALVIISWEAFEFFFDAKTRFFYDTYPLLWRLDAAGDITAGFLGAYGYRVFAARRQ